MSSGYHTSDTFRFPLRSVLRSVLRNVPYLRFVPYIHNIPYCKCKTVRTFKDATETKRSYNDRRTQTKCTLFIVRYCTSRLQTRTHMEQSSGRRATLRYSYLYHLNIKYSTLLELACFDLDRICHRLLY